MKYEDRKKIRDEFKDPVDLVAVRADYILWLEEQLHTVRLAMSQVDDELIVNWIAPPTDGNYRKALNQLVCSGVEIHKYFENESKRTDAVCDSDFPFTT